NIPEKEMFKAFNMGIGMVLIVSQKDSEKIVLELKKQFSMDAVILGETIKGKGIKLEKPFFKEK
ncbi:MAG: phosphoribosylformylglycinamidine cyclo-ligase, partial [Candidatus Diapherotrites archaeon CG_4_10_14_0_2_um_filter_31_5]